MEQEKYDKARENYQKSIIVDHNFKAASKEWTNMLEKQKKYKEAAEKYERANSFDEALFKTSFRTRKK